MWLWKLAALAELAIFVGWLVALVRGTTEFDVEAKIGLIIDSVALFGLLAYAFSIDAGPTKFWAIFHGFFAAWFLCSLWREFGRHLPKIDILISATLLSLMGTICWLALYRLGGSPFGELPAI